MEKEKKKIMSLDERLARAREVANKSLNCTFRYKIVTSPSKREGCNHTELSQEEALTIIPQLTKVFKQEIEISRFNVLCVSDPSYLKFGIENGEGLIGGKECRFKYLMIQNGEFPGIEMCCKDREGKGMDHEIFPIFSVSCLPEESQELISSILDIVESRME